MVTFYKPAKKDKAPKAVKVTCTDLDLQGRGVAKEGDKVYFVDGLMPTEVANVQVSPDVDLKKQRIVNAKITKIIKRAENRLESDCPVSGTCGGCSMQHVPSDMLINSKVEGIIRLFSKSINQDIGRPSFVHSGNSTHYRRACRFAVRGDHGKLYLGYRQEKSHALVRVESCVTLTDRINKFIVPVNRLLNTLSVKDKVGHVEFLDSDGALAILFRITVALPEADENKLREFGKENDLVISVIEPYKDKREISKVETTRERFVAGSMEDLYITSAGVRINCKPSSFVQVNSEINEKMLSTVLYMIKPAPGLRVMDLFCGLGNFAMPIAKAGACVVGVDIVFKMIEDARANAKNAGLSNASFEVADLEELFENQTWAKAPYDAVVMDPGRSGAKRATLFLAKRAKNKSDNSNNKVKKIVLISCNPLAASRDAVELVNSGYKITSWGVCDMFPRTTHVEMVLEFSLMD